MVQQLASVYDNEESQILPWAESFVLWTQVQPAFELSESGQCFGFKASVPSRAPWVLHHSHWQLVTLNIIRSTASVASFPSSRNSSMFLARASCTLSTVPTSCTPFKCGTNNKDHNMYDSCLAQPMLHRPQSFCQPPLPPPRMSSTLATKVRDDAGDCDSLAIDEASPDEDKHLAESVVHGQCKHSSISPTNPEPYIYCRPSWCTEWESRCW